MKKILISGLISIGLATSLMASGNWGIGAGTKVHNGSDVEILGIQSIQELVGDGGTDIFVEGTYRVDQVKVGTRVSNNADLDENKIELIWQFDFANKDTSAFYLNGGAGFGIQSGKTKTISTNITKVEYITAKDLSVYKTPTTATIDDSQFITISLGVGYKYNISNNLSLSAGYEFERKYWDMSYTVEGKSVINDISGTAQNFHGAKVSLEYKF